VAERWRIKHDDSQASGLSVDAGTEPTAGVAYTCSGVGNPVSGSTPSTACAGILAAYSASQGSTHSFTVTTATCTVPSPNGSCSYAGQWDFGTKTTLTAQYVAVSSSSCAPYIDSTGAARAGSLGLDGKCATGRYQGIAFEEAQAQATKYPPISIDSDLYKAVQGAVDTGGQSVVADIDVTGPASQVGTPTSTTTTDSTGTKTTSSQPTYNYTYAGDTVTYTTTNNTYTCAGAGSCSAASAVSSTSTTTGTTATAQDPSDPCTANPDRVGCKSLGTAPEDKVPTAQRSLTYTAESLSLAAACPADQVMSTSKGQIVVSYAPTCDAATKARPWVIAGGALASLLLVLAALREC